MHGNISFDDFSNFFLHLDGNLDYRECDVNIFSVCFCVYQPVSAAVGLESLAAQRVAVARPVPESWMVKRPDREASLML